MSATFSVGRVAGTRVGVHWSVLVVLLLVAAGLGGGRLPHVHGGHTAWTYWGLGSATAVFSFASLLAHEISHAVVARHYGVTVDGITLWLLGGVARSHGEAPSAGAALRVAGVGPLVSLVLGALFGALSGLLGALHGSGLLVEALAWLAGINVLLVLFNILPAVPLDGGRLLRALVWRRTGDALRATQIATVAGRSVGWVLIAAALYLLFLGAAFSGIWLAVIGWFLIASASVEGGRARRRDLLCGVSVRDVMTPKPRVVPADLPVAGFLGDPALRHGHSAFPVIDAEGRPLGLVTVQQAAGVPREEQRGVVLGSLMVPLADLATAGPDDPLATLLPSFEAGPSRRMLVLSGAGDLEGIITSSDISRLTAWPPSIASRPEWDSCAGDRQRRSGTRRADGV